MDDAYIVELTTRDMYGDPLEYFCYSCGQLRLSFCVHTTQRGSCGSKDIRLGECGSLNKEALKAEYAKNKETRVS